MRKVSSIEAAALFLLVVAGWSRTWTAGLTRFSHDEVRSISRSLGTFVEIAAWQPGDWPPLYYWVLSIWKSGVGLHPLMLRYSGVLFFLFGAAAIYQVGGRLFRSRRVGLYCMLIYGSLGMNVFLTTQLRGYSLALMLYPLALLALVQYIDRGQWPWAFPLGIALAALFYTTYLSVLAFFPLVLFAFVLRPRRWWWWALPGLVALVVAAPEILHSYSTFLSPSFGGGASFLSSWFVMPDVPLSEFDNFIVARFGSFAGHASLILAALAVAAVPVVVTRTERLRVHLFLTLWVVGSLLFAASFGITYNMLFAQWWWYFTLWQALFLGLGLAYFPRLVRWPAFAYLSVIPFVPVHEADFFFLGMQHFPFEDVFELLDDEWQTGDVLYLDANCPIFDPSPTRPPTCGSPEEWDYYQMVYFPEGELQVVDDPGRHRRVWYVHDVDRSDRVSREDVMNGRIPSTFMGPRNFRFHLYEAPPDSHGIAFENGIRFHGVDILDPHLNGKINRGFVTRRVREPLELRLWWSTDIVLDLDYSVSVQVALDDMAPALTQWDGSPALIHLQCNDFDPLPELTSEWEPGQLYVQSLTLDGAGEIAFDYMARDSWLYVMVYQWWDGTALLSEASAPNGRVPVRRLRFLTY